MMNCPHCHRPLAVHRHGLTLPVIKGRLLDAIESANGGRITTRDLMAAVYVDRPTPNAPATIRSHIVQMNRSLATVGLQIGCVSRRYWVLRRTGRRRLKQEAAITPVT